MTTPLKKWYYHSNIVSLISKFMTPQEIGTAMCVCKSLYTILNSDIIWWNIYNKTFGSIRIIDPAIFSSRNENSKEPPTGLARKAYMKVREGIVNFKLKEFKVEPKNSHTVYIYGRLGLLKTTETIVKEFGDHYDLMSAFGSVFVCGGELSKICVIALPNLTTIRPNDTVAVLFDSENYQKYADALFELLKRHEPKKIVAIINGSKGEYSNLYELLSKALLIPIERGEIIA